MVWYEEMKVGSWNETCMVSNLAIQYDEPTIAYILRPRFTNAGDIQRLFYSTELYEPISFPIFGRYDSYGSICEYDEKDTSVRHILMSLQESSLKHLIFQIHDGQVTYKLVLIKHSIYKALVDSSSKNRPQHFKEKDILKRIRKFRTPLSNNEVSIELSALGLNYMNNFRFKSLFSLIRHSGQDDYIKNLTNMLNEDSEFCESISRLRKLWFPTTATGSQSFGHRDHLALNRAIHDDILKSFNSPIEAYLEILDNKNYY